MASLSYYSNSNSNSNLEPNMQQLNDFLFDFNYDHSFPKPETCYFDPFFDSNPAVEPNYSSCFVPEIQEYSDFQMSNPKRQKVFQFDNCHHQDIITQGNLSNGQIYQDFSSFSFPENIPTPQLEYFPSPPIFSSSSHDQVVEKNEKKMSAQSIAARQRRKKITEKTQELGKLIPGGHRMNTAEMLQATFKYVKFLQAQVGLLEFMGSHQENGKSYETPDLQKLVGSSLIQEKLYSSDNCLVPKVFLEELDKNHEFQHSQGLDQVKKLIR
ncbi:transcription factor bHLH53-like [Nicotiana tabacum]|uniref:Transcription factor bHLH53-like n=1 Tax=Nicotiana tabacum TaxID=4097 RepID=A0A1S3XQK2_TOBAC|nr:transcription factor bHLH53-like [Nicotiana tomentosiformis]XP_016442231.1 PREDICTED: transcription factor bHLH53-like [Nicotiana tabacum]